MEIKIRLARESDLQEYTNLLQKVYQDTYTNDSIGLKKEFFSKEIFNTLDTQKYLLANLQITDKQKCWLAFLDSKLVGSISIIERDYDYELRGFYVALKHQNKGIGKKLWQYVLSFAKKKILPVISTPIIQKLFTCIRNGDSWLIQSVESFTATGLNGLTMSKQNVFICIIKVTK